MKINNFRGDLTDISAKKEALMRRGAMLRAAQRAHHELTSAFADSVFAFDDPNVHPSSRIRPPSFGPSPHDSALVTVEPPATTRTGHAAFAARGSLSSDTSPRSPGRLHRSGSRDNSVSPSCDSSFNLRPSDSASNVRHQQQCFFFQN